MNAHPDREHLLAFREHRLSGAEIATIAGHLANCPDCGRGDLTTYDALLASLTPGLLEDHLTDAQLDSLLDRDAGAVEDHSVMRHLRQCAMCSEELADLQRFQSGDDTTEVARPNRAADATSPARRWMLPAAAVVTIAIAGGSLLLFRQKEQPVIATTKPAAVTPSAVTPSAAAPAVTPSPVVASLVDHAQTIRLLQDGTIGGVAFTSDGDAAMVREALRAGAAQLPAFAGALAASALRSEGVAEPGSVHLIEPAGTAVRSGKPRFSWRAVPAAKSYRVAVFDDHYNEVAASEAITATSWTPSQTLPAGVVLSWQVTAALPDGEVSSSGAHQTETKLVILDREQEKAVKAMEARYPSSSLIRGLAFAHYGLIPEAERELQNLVRENPDSPIARRLLASVRSGR